MDRRLLHLSLWISVLILLRGAQSESEASETSRGTVNAVLNGLSIAFDADTGGIRRLDYEGVGTFLDAPKEKAGLLDLAYPIPDFEPLRLATRFSTGAALSVSDQSAIVSWENLGPSRSFKLPGAVSATVELRAATDGRSIVLTCELHNRSPHPIRQVLFPDFAGLLPFAGVDGTLFRTAGSSLKPFRELKTSEYDRFYATNASFKTLRSGDSNDTEMIVRWMDLGGLEGGFSLFPRRWGWDPQTRVILNLSDKDSLLRLMNEHTEEIGPGANWSSGEFWLTPHRYGWAKGIEPYREWARRNMRRPYPLPEHVRKGLGFRSIWMCQNQEHDPRDANWRFRDLVELARESKDHGLDEMVMWIWHKPFLLPFPPPYSHLGSEEELIRAAEECKAIGVNLAPFVSVLQAEKSTAERYGLSVTPGSGNWTYHTEFIPKFNPGYASRFTCVQMDTTDPKWQEEVLSSCRQLIGKGIASLCWDQYWSVPEEPNLNTLTRQIREIAKQADPESTFGGEELKNFEINCDYLDYTWNWKAHEQIQPLISVFPTPRMNVNVNHAVETVYRCFADNLYMNVWPMKPDSTNGSDWISNDPELSRAVKRCAKLRSQFLDYFTEGILIGDCVLSEPCEDAHVSAYVMPEKVLVIASNAEVGKPVRLNCDVEPWIDSGGRGYRLTSYDSEGRPREPRTLQSGGVILEGDPMEAPDVALFEWTVEMN